MSKRELREYREVIELLEGYRSSKMLNEKLLLDLNEFICNLEIAELRIYKQLEKKKSKY